MGHPLCSPRKSGVYTHSCPDPTTQVPARGTGARVRSPLGTWFPAHSLSGWLCDIWHRVYLSGLLPHLEPRELNLPPPEALPGFS